MMMRPEDDTITRYYAHKNLKEKNENVDGDMEVNLVSKRKRSSEVETAVAMLLGLSQSEGFVLTDESKAPDNGFHKKSSTIANKNEVTEWKHVMTRKGLMRLGPGDNRVRPPKAATRLLPEAKWRHIRLPYVESALEAEDWVVMFAHFRDPVSLPREKLETMLNYRLSHYDEQEMKKQMAEVTSTSDLENLLKVRYGVAVSKKGKIVGDNMLSQNEPILPIHEDPEKQRDTLLFHHQDKEKHQENMKSDSSMRSQTCDPNELTGTSHIQVMKNRIGYRKDVKDKAINILGKHRSDSKQKKSENLSLSYAESKNPNSFGIPGIEDREDDAGRMDNYVHQSSQTLHGISQKQVGENWGPSTKGSCWTVAKDSQSGSLHGLKEATPAAQDDQPSGGKRHGLASSSQAGVVHYRNAGERPGRPPSYDGMVHWCVKLKRALWQRHVSLTIEEAISMVNDMEFYLEDDRIITKSLVPSTLRKRVFGLYGITWSQVATEIDQNGRLEISDPSVLSAAANILKKHGLDPEGKLPLAMNNNESGQAPSTDLPSHPKVPERSQGIDGTIRNAVDEKNDFNMKMAHAEEKYRANIGSQIVVSGQGAAYTESRVISLHESLTNPGLAVRDIVRKGTTSFLTSEEVLRILFDAASGKLPLSSRVPRKPPSGSMFLYDRYQTSKFRSDGYVWRRRETHANRKVGDWSCKLNCYYAGTLEDEIQRRCYWVIDMPSPDERQRSHIGNIVFVHYLGTGAKNPSQSDEMKGITNEISLEQDSCREHGGAPSDSISTAVTSVKSLIANVDVMNLDAMFSALCCLNQLPGIIKQDCAKLCRLWMENKLDDKQKRQMFVFIKSNINDIESVAEWVKEWVK